MSRRPVPVDLLNEPLVVDGTKYRIREIVSRSGAEGDDWTPARVRARAWRYEPRREVVAEVMEYDPRAGVFRGREVVE